MRRVLLLGALLLTLVTPTACDPKAGGGGGGNGGPPPGATLRAYHVDIAVKDVDKRTARRQLVCIIKGFKGKTVIMIEDRKTGKRAPYMITIDDISFKSPQILRLEVYTGLTSIYVRCGTLGVPGDTILCEPTDPDQVSPSCL